MTGKECQWPPSWTPRRSQRPAIARGVVPPDEQGSSRRSASPKGLSSGEIAMSYWPVDGQEAMSAGAMLALGRVRPAGHHLSRAGRCASPRGSTCAGTSARSSAESTGLSKGKAGAMGIFDPDHGIAWTTGIVGAGPLIANGIALAAPRDDDQVVLVSFGDGATSIGYVHEAMNMAAIVVACPSCSSARTTAWAEGTAMARYTRSRHAVRPCRRLWDARCDSRRHRPARGVRRRCPRPSSVPGRAGADRSSKPSRIGCRATTSAMRCPTPILTSSRPNVPTRRSRDTENV